MRKWNSIYWKGLVPIYHFSPWVKSSSRRLTSVGRAAAKWLNKHTHIHALSIGASPISEKYLIRSLYIYAVCCVYIVYSLHINRLSDHPTSSLNICEPIGGTYMLSSETIKSICYERALFVLGRIAADQTSRAHTTIQSVLQCDAARLSHSLLWFVKQPIDAMREARIAPNDYISTSQAGITYSCSDQTINQKNT